MLRKLLLTFIFTILLFGKSEALPLFDIGLQFGLSTPNDKINDVYNTNKLTQEDMLGNLARDAARNGFHIGLLVRVPLSSGFVFRGGIAWHRFPTTDITVTSMEIPTESVPLSTTQDLFPINLGVNYLVIDGMLFSMYGVGELAYYHFSNDVDYDCRDLSSTESFSDAIFDKSPTYNRVGFGLGLGFDFKLQVVKLNLEAKYNVANLIGQEGNEEMKNFITVSLGAFL